MLSQELISLSPGVIVYMRIEVPLLNTLSLDMALSKCLSFRDIIDLM